MKRRTAIPALLSLLCCVHCASGGRSASAAGVSVETQSVAAVDTTSAGPAVTADAGRPDGRVEPAEAAFVVVSKQSMTLAVYDFRSRLLAAWPMACGKALGNKERPGDMKTPEGCFSVQQIQDARGWTHDFGDGRGEIRGAYGSHFIRLRTPGHSGIGIHGTHDPASIGTRATEGCIRLDNEDLLRLIGYVYVGMPVVILTSEADAAVPCCLPAAAKKGPEVTRRDASAMSAGKPDAAGDGPATAQNEKVPETKAPAGTAASESGQILGTRSAAAPTEKSPPARSAATNPVPAQHAVTRRHTVRQGESLSTIAERYGMKLSRLRELNPQVKSDRINAGQRLVVEPRK